MTERLRILLVEDVADDAELALLELRRAGLHADPWVVDSEKSFVGALREFAPDAILCDFSMPAFDGMAALKRLSSSFLERSAKTLPSTRSRAAPPTM